MFLINKKSLKRDVVKKLQKLHLLDIFFIGFFFILILLFILIFSRSDQKIQIKVKVTDQNVYFLSTQPPDEYSYSFHQGDVERNEVGKIVAQIEKVNRLQTSPGKYLVYLNLSIKANYNPLKQQYSYQGRPIIFGQDLEFDFANTKVSGLIVDFPQYRQPDKKAIKLLVTAQLRNDSRSFSDTYGMPKFYEKAIENGQILANNEGQIVIVVKNITSLPAKRTIVTANNQSLTIDDSELVDIVYTLEVNAYEVEGKTYIFDYLPIQVGSNIPMILDNVSIWPIITSFQKL